MVSDNKTLDKVYTAKNHEDLMDAYKDWAAHYDKDTVGEFGYVAPVSAGRTLHGFLGDPSARVLDAGCGTGLVGEVLSGLGYANLDALDFSEAMLGVAKGKGVYQNHFHADLSKPLDIKDNAYDAVVCVGTFTYGHVDAGAFDELNRITRPQGFVTFTIREGAYDDYGYRDRMLALERDDVWELQEMRDEDYLRNEGVSCKLCTYRVLSA